MVLGFASVASAQPSGIAVSLSPTSVTLYGGQSLQFVATVQNTLNQAVTWSIGSAVGSVSTSGLYSAPATVTVSQSVMITATSVADSTKSATATVTLLPAIAVSITPPSASLGANQTQQLTANLQNAPGSGASFVPSSAAVWTNGYDHYRTNANFSEPVITPSNASSLKRLGSFAVDAYIYAQPLFVGQTTLHDGSTHDLLLVATMNNTLYAFDANSPGQAALWSVNFGATNVNTTTPISPIGAGIVSTPVVDLTNKLVYLVYENATPSWVLAKVDLLTGNVLSSVTITGQVPGTGDSAYLDTVSGPNLVFYPKYELQRAGLVLANGQIYVAFASWGDVRPEHGWMFAYDAVSLTQNKVVCLSPNSWGGTIWQSGGGPAVDDNGNLYVATGNGAGTTDLSESFVKFDPSLNLLSYFQPANWMSMSASNFDFSGRTMIVPGQSLIISGSKDHNVYGLDLGFDGPLQFVSEAGTTEGVYNGAIFNGRVYTADGQIFAHPINGTTIGTTAATTVNSYNQPVSVSGSCNGTSNCVLWGTTMASGAGTLRAFDATTLTELYNSDMAANGADALGKQARFVSPIVVNGRVYVATDSNTVQVYGVPLSTASSNQTITGTSVTWMLTPNIGSISSSGLYTAPATISASQTVTVIAVSQADWTKSASTTISLYPAPGITTQPQSQSVATGGTATFTVVASGPGLSYQWWSAPAGSSSFSPIGGATGSSYTTGTVSQAVNGTQYECVVSDTFGSTTSNIAVLSWLAPGTDYVAAATLGSVRNNFTGWVGMKVTVAASSVTVSRLGRVFVTGNTGTHIVKIVNAATSQDVSGGSVSVSMTGGSSGAFSYANLPTPVTLSANTSYYIVSQETLGGDSWYDVNTTIQTTSVAAEKTGVYSSDGATYNLLGSANQSYGPVDFVYSTASVQPAITGQPQSVTVGVGGSTTFSVSATGGNLGYQWASAPSGSSNFTAIGGATGSSYTVSGVTMAQTGTQYMCTVSNTAGTISSNVVTLTVVAVPPSTNYVTSTALGTIRNDFTGWVGMKVTVGSSPVTVSGLGRIFAPGNTATHTLKIVNAATSQDVSGGSVSILMAGGTAGTFVYANLAATVTLSANTSYYIMSQETQGGDSWYDMNTTIQTTSVAAETTSVYSYDGATYNLFGPANQSYGPVDFTYTTSVSQPGITGQPQNVTVGVGGSATFSVSATGGGLSYQWASAPSGSSTFTAISGATGSSYTVSGVTMGQTGTQYVCTVSNTAGSVPSNIATMTVVAVPPSTNYVTSTTLGTIRNNFTGWVGMKVTVGSSPVTVSGLGRIFAPGDTGTHTVKIVNAATSQDVSGGSVSVATAGGTGGTFKYANLAATVTLSANTSYYILSQETQGGDSWYDIDTALQTASIATETSGVYSYDGAAYSLFGSANHSYGPVDFTYTTGVSQPGITGQPQNVTVGVGGSATFSVSATGGGLSYQWASAPSGSSTFTPIGGATGSSYTVSGVTMGQTGTQYMCTVSNTAGSVPSNVATMTVVAVPPSTNYVTSTALGTIRNNFTGWVGMKVTVGTSPVTVSGLGRIFAPGDTGTHTVKIVTAQTSQDVSGGSVSILMAGGTAGTFVYANLAATVTLSANTSYYIVTQETQGGDSWYDVDTAIQTASVAVESTGVYSYDGATYSLLGSANHSYGPVDFTYTTAVSQPAIANQPQSVTVGVGGSATFSVSATGGNLSYQWASAPSGSSTFTAISGATGSSYTVSGVTMGQTGTQYLCTVSSTAGSLPSSVATLTVVAVPPSTNYVTSTTLGTIRNNFSGWVGMQISVGATPLTVSGLGRIFAPGDTGTHTVKIVTAATGQDVSGGSVSIATAGGTAGTFVYANLAATVTLNANTNYYIVSQESQGGDPWYDIDTTVQTTAVATEKGGIWSSDGVTYNTDLPAPASYGPVDFLYTTAVSVTVTPPTANLWPNDTAQFTASVTGNSGVTWSLNPATNSGSITTAGFYTAPSSIPSQTTVTVKATSVQDTTKYATATVTLNPLAAPQITQQPQSTTVAVGQTATFSVTATGGSLTYQWESEVSGGNSFAPITGATSSSYTTLATAQTDSGTQFECVVTNSLGPAVVSNPATLTVASATAAFVTSDTFGPVRNDYDGYIGMKIVVGSSPITIVSLGRISVTGNNGTHQLKIVDASAGSDEDSGSIYYVYHPGVDVVGGSTNVNMAGGTPGTFVYANLPTPITLNANTPYYILSLETNGGDAWYDHAGTTAQTTAVASLTNAVYGTGSPYAVKNDSTGTMYGPLDFKYIVP
jgi:predicted transglutaminase-like cysteine proteinase